VAYRFTTIDNPIDRSFSRVVSINDAGQISGLNGSGFAGHPYSSYQANGYGPLAFSVVSNAAYAQTEVSSLDNYGRTVGRVVDAAGNSYGAIETGGLITAIDDPGVPTSGQRTSYFSAANDFGVAVGAYYDAAHHLHGRVYDVATGVSTILDVPGATSTVLRGIDNAGDIVDTLFINGTSRGFVYGNGITTFMNGPAGALDSTALAINNQGQIAGQYLDGSGYGHGFIYSVATNAYTTIDDPRAASGTAIYGINDQSQIVGSYLDASGKQHGFLASPQAGMSVIDNPSTGTILSVAPGSTGLQAGGANTVTLVDRTLGTIGVKLIANDGNDVLVSIASPDTLMGGAGNDTFFTGTSTSLDYLGGGSNIVVTGGDTTVNASTGNDIVFSGGGRVVAYGGTSGTMLIQEGGLDSTVVGGAGYVAAFAGSGHVFDFGANGQSILIGGDASSYFEGGAGDATIYAGAGGGSFNGGSGNGVFVTRGHSTVTAGIGPSQIYLGGDGDMASLVGGANNVVAGATGNVTLLGGQSTGNNLFLLGDGGDSVVGGQGSDIFYLGAGFGQITGGGGPDVYAATHNVGGLDIIHGFRLGTDQLVLNGFDRSEAQFDLATQLNSGGSTTLNLSDGTKLTFEGIGRMDASLFG